jgi:Spherulation-specific family 4
VDFIVVINPASGPGLTPTPDPNYTREITKLNQFSNVRTIGYVAVDYGRKLLQNTYLEIDKYSGWGETNQQLAMQGIFLDESPQIADEHNSTYLESVRNYIKGQKPLAGGLLGEFPSAYLNLSFAFGRDCAK